MVWRIDFNYDLSVRGGDGTIFRFPKENYTLGSFKDELITINGAVFSSVNVWHGGLWVSYGIGGRREEDIHIGDLVHVVLKSAGAYWETDMSFFDQLNYYSHYYITDFMGYQIRAWHIFIILIVLATIIILMSKR